MNADLALLRSWCGADFLCSQPLGCTESHSVGTSRCINPGWAVYQRQRKYGEAVFYGPVDCWIGILTRFPCVVLAIGVVAPAGIGFYGLQQCGFSPPINMDFASYLAVDLQIQFVYDCVQERCWGQGILLLYCKYLYLYIGSIYFLHSHAFLPHKRQALLIGAFNHFLFFLCLLSFVAGDYQTRSSKKRTSSATNPRVVQVALPPEHHCRRGTWQHLDWTILETKL